MYRRLPEGEENQKQRSTSCLVLVLVLVFLMVLGVLLAVAVLERPAAPPDPPELPQEEPGGNYTEDQCNLTLVESIPLHVTYGANETVGVPLEQVWKGLIAMATQQVEVASFYWTLTGDDIHVNTTWDRPGREILQDLQDLPSRNVSVRLVSSVPSVAETSSDLKVLQQKGVQVRQVDFGRLTGGVLHSKFWVVDRKHVFIGSANMDWRALTQVKELGVALYNCSGVAEDLLLVFQSYWDMGASGSSLPEVWPQRYNAPFNRQRPLLVEEEGNTSSSFYLSASPPSFCPPTRTQDLEALLSSISEAQEFIDVAVMEYFPTTRFSRPRRYWPLIDEVLRSSVFESRVKLRLLVSCSRDSDPQMLPFLLSLDSLSSSHLLVQIRLFILPVLNQSSIPYSRVNHNKYMLTDKVALIGTSNWSGDYFMNTAGVSLVVSQNAAGSGGRAAALRRELRDVFERDWRSEFSVPLRELGRHPNCALTP